MDLKQLYSKIVMEHARATDYKYEQEAPTFVERGHNPSCGDEITLSLRVEDGVIQEASFSGHGCAISQASTSMLCDLVTGETVGEAKRQVETFLGMIKGEITDTEQLEQALGDAVALQSISHMPQRVKCAVLAWHTLDVLLNKEANAASANE